MEDDFHKSGIYRWKRQTKPRVHSRSQKVATTNDIQDWLQKVEDASNTAIGAVLGTEAPSAYSGRQKARDAVRGVADHARIEDEAYNEAQDLLKEWLTHKVGEDDPYNLQDDPDLDCDPYRKHDLGSRARKEWDNLLNGNLEELGIESSPRVRIQSDDADPYANLYELDDDAAVSAVVQTMMGKQLVKDAVRNDLGFDPDMTPDPRTKMALRHQRVKDNREKRESELRRKRHEQETKKQARLTAKQIVLKEEKEKELRQRREEQEVRKQMAQIRKEMHESQRRQADDRHRAQQESEEKTRLVLEELSRQQAVERGEMLRRQQELSQRRQAELARAEVVKARLQARNLRTLHGHFTAWYDVVLQRRLAYGRARALADWRLSLRVWNAWRAYARDQRVAVETKVHERNVVEESRKWAVAKRHHYLSELRHAFSTWRHFVTKEQDRRRLQLTQQATRNKMASLLAAVADGSVAMPPSARSETASQGGGASSRQDGKVKVRKDANNVGREVDEMFSQPPQRRTAWEEDSDVASLPSSRPESALSSVSRGQGQGHRLPRDGWQVTRKHAHMSKAELAEFFGQEEAGGESEAGSDTHTHHTDVKIRRRFGTQPWMNRQYTVNNLEHRFSAQQKLLRQQQSAIQEQKRLIEDLVFSQQQQKHREQLAEISPPKQPGPKGDGDWESKSDPPASDAGGKVPKVKVKSAESRPPHQGSAKVTTPSSQGPSEAVNTQRSAISTARTDSASTDVTVTSATSSGQSNAKYIQILKNMEGRAAERARLKAERDEKRRKADDERLERLKAEEEEMKRKAEEEKQARVQAYREKKRLEKQREQDKQRELEHQRELTAKADAHYQRALMKFRVLLPMKRLVQMGQEQAERAERHHNHHILRRVIAAWKSHTDELTAEKNQLADSLHGYIMVRRCFHSWKKFKYRMVFLERRAERHYKETTLPKLFAEWRDFTVREKLEEMERKKVADEFHPRSLQRKVFRAWRRLPQELRREAEREKLRSEMRRKVADLLPDFKPAVSVDKSNDSLL